MRTLGRRLMPGLLSLVWLGCSASQLPAQNQAAISEFFEGKHVTVRMDMPASQQGVDVYPQKPQPLDLKNYQNRLKKYGTSLRNGDSVMVTKVKVKDDNIEFQLGGGGYGTAFDDTDSSVHFSPSDKSGREKELEDRLRSETDPDRRRSLQRELDDVRRDRERRDRRDQANATEAAEMKRERIDSKRLQGGSRFNIHMDTRKAGETLTPQFIMSTLEPYLVFSDGPNAADAASRTQALSDPAGPRPPEPPNADPVKDLRKGLTRAQVEALFGPATESHDRSENGLAITTAKFLSKDATIQGDFVNGVLVQYTLTSR